MAKISAWMRKHLLFRPGREKQSAAQPPFLSSTRRPITPKSFGTATCLFFQLPYDIRISIVLMAFSRRTMHLDVLHEEGIWRWRGGVCTRHHPRLPPSLRYGWPSLCADGCTHTLERRRREGNTADWHDVGIMGFLLSSRQAYSEGIDILYSANCISIMTEPLLLDLPKFILCDRLASVTSIEILVEAHLIKQEDGRSSWDLDHLGPMLENIAKYCRHLRRFCLCFSVWQRHGHDLLDGPALPLVDAFWRSLRLRHMRIELPYRDYCAAKISDSVSDHPCETPRKGPFHSSRWRSLDSEEPTIQWRSIERFPLPPLKLPILDDRDESQESMGYWLSENGVGPPPHAATLH
jgi:hypothetical protein